MRFKDPYKNRVVYLDPNPDPPLVIPHPECPQAEQHTPSPKGYMEHHEWMARMARERRTCRRCPACGLWVIWE